MKTPAVVLLLAAILTLAATSCHKSIDAEAAALGRYAKHHQVGSSPDVWLELNNVSGEWEKVALVMGYYDDREGCEDIARTLEQEFGRKYRCAPVG
ncbi:MAG: hypothetical protein R3C00_09350 [Hyphomonas sp.]|nr:hypothetical protein [Hyphomonas sp.]MCB9970748.1 hypothetical protein [Hyphomonas sp.]